MHSVKFRSSYFDKVRKNTYNTNRMIHKRFLDRSEAWRISGEAAAAAAEIAEELDEAAEVAPAAATDNANTWRPLTLDHFYNSEDVVTNRIKVVLRKATNQMVAHSDIIPLVVRLPIS